MSKKKRVDPLPKFKSIAEEADFWDTHSVVDYWDKSQPPLKVTVAKNLSSGITVRLDPHTLNAVREKAQKKGLGPTQLIRMWIFEKLAI